MKTCSICNRPSGTKKTCSPECLSKLRSINSRANKKKTPFARKMEKEEYPYREFVGEGAWETNLPEKYKEDNYLKKLDENM